MRQVGPYGPNDLDALGRLFDSADRVVTMREIFHGDTNPRTIGLRHDVDGHPGSFETAFAMAEWEFNRGFSATYFLLHGADYWNTQNLERAREFEDMGHEVGVHVNAIAESHRTGIPAETILHRTLHELRGAGLEITGAQHHGDRLCRHLGFVNDQMFVECQRDGYTAPADLGVVPLPLSAFGLEYESWWLPHGDYITDAGRAWSQDFGEVCNQWPARGQLHMNIHPDWWVGAFERVTV